MILIIDMNSNKLGRDEFVLPIGRIVKDYEIKHYTEKFDINKYDKIILSGTPLKDDKYLDYDFSFLKNYKKPVLGICAGMQVIGKLFGCKIIKCKEIGMTKIKTIKENELVEGEFEAYELHQNSITAGDFEVLAESSGCIQVVKKDNFYGIMFHPEVRNNDVVERFCNNL